MGLKTFAQYYSHVAHAHVVFALFCTSKMCLREALSRLKTMTESCRCPEQRKGAMAVKLTFKIEKF